MVDEGQNGTGRRAPATVVNGTRVTVAFPFSSIKLEESSAELRALAELVADLADVVAATTGADLDDVRRRAREFVNALAATNAGNAAPSAVPAAVHDCDRSSAVS